MRLTQQTVRNKKLIAGMMGKFKIIVGANVVGFLLSYPILLLERAHPDGQIDNITQSLWLLFQTISTIGFGEVSVAHDASKILLAIAYLLTRVAFVVVLVVGFSRVMGKSNKERLTEYDRLTVIENQLKLLRVNMKDLVDTSHVEAKERRLKKIIKCDFHVNSLTSLMDVSCSPLAKGLKVVCHFSKRGIKSENEIDYWLMIAAARESGVHSIQFSDSLEELFTR